MSQIYPLCLFLGELTANTPSTTRVTPKQAARLPQPTATTTVSVSKQTARELVTAQSGMHLKTTTQQVTTASTATPSQEAVRTTKTTNRPNKSTQRGRNTASTTLQSSQTGKKWL